MPRYDFDQFYIWDVPSQSWVAYATPSAYGTITVRFPGSMSGSPLKLVLFPTLTASTTIFISLGKLADFNNGYLYHTHSENISLTGNVRISLTLPSNLVSQLSASGNTYMSIGTYSNTPFHLTGAERLHISSDDSDDRYIKIKAYAGGSFKDHLVKVYNAGSFKEYQAKIYVGGSWKDAN